MENTVTILHMADLHLGAKFNGLSSDKAAIRKSEIRQSFLNCVENHKQADVVLLAGDIFDCTEYNAENVNFLISVFEKFSDIIFFIVCGNHDPYNSAVYDRLTQILPENAIVFPPYFDEVVIEKLKLRVYGISFSSEYQNTPLLKGFKAKDDNYINIMVMHGDTTNENSVYNPISLFDISNSNIDYLALGHVHSFGGINKADDVTYAYSGTHEGHGFDETGHLGCIYGTVSKHRADVNFECSCIRKYKNISVDISSQKTIEGVKQLIESSVNNRDLFKIELCGELNEGIILNDFVLLAGLNVFYINISKNVHKPYNLEELKSEVGIKGCFAENALMELSQCEDANTRDIIKRAAKCVLSAFENGGKIQ